MSCYITNGKTFIKLDNTGTPMTCGRDKAQKFSEEKANNILKALPKRIQKFNYEIEIEEDIKEEEETIIDVLTELDDVYEDYNETIIQSKDNVHTYKGRTYIEDLVDIPGQLADIIVFMSQIDDYVENMKYMQRELDLKIMDYRHYIRNNKTKLGTVHMGKVGYDLQELERKREECKRNKNCCLVFANNLERFKNKNYVEVLHNICNSEYRYRRMNEEDIKASIGKK